MTLKTKVNSVVSYLSQKTKKTWGEKEENGQYPLLWVLEIESEASL